MASKSTSSKDTGSKGRPKTPEATRQALKSAGIASTELVRNSKSLLQANAPVTSSDSSQPPLDAISKLASLIHSHTVRTALTCGPTASSPSATLNCIKDLHEPILPLISEYQSLSTSLYPEYFIICVQKEITSLLDTFGAFVGEVVEIACGDAEVESRERLQYSGMMMEVCDRIQRLCEDGPMPVLRKTLHETAEMLNDALEEIVQIITATEVDDGWSDEPIEYTPEQKTFARRAQSKLRYLSFLYKAISKRRMPANLTYHQAFRTKLDTIHECLSKLSVVVDDLVAGISAQEDPMDLELSVIQIVDLAQRLATTVKFPLNVISDGKEIWFDNWLKSMVV
jgi:hypothetical protein